MPAEEFAIQRLSDLLNNLKEDLDLEVKSWLDPKDSIHDKAKLARSIIAMANHGGGDIVLGFKEKEQSGEIIEDEDRPGNLTIYRQEIINGIVQKYCDPSFHCAVHMVPHRQKRFPVITVPGKHKVPIRARKSSPEDSNELKDNAIYIRRPGPSSEEPRTSNDWDQLLSRCLRNRGNELLDQIRGFMSSEVQQKESYSVSPPKCVCHVYSGEVQQKNQGFAVSKLDEWVSKGYERWHEKIDVLPVDSEARLSRGYYCFAYEIIGKRKKTELANLPNTLQDCKQPFTGWPLFQWPYSEEITPCIIGDSIECWLGGDTRGQVDAAHADFWRFHPEGRGFVLRGYHIDCMASTMSPGDYFYISTPIWRVGEVLLHARAVSKMLFEEPEAVRFIATFSGLEDRKLVYSTDGGRHYFPIRNYHVAAQDKVKLNKDIEVGEVDHRLPEVVHSVLSDLYAHFGFFKIEIDTVNNELNRMIDRV